MHVINFLMDGDPTIQRLTKKHLLDQEVIYDTSGYIQRYIDLFDPETNTWGKGIYGPKWISTHYTMLELKNLEIDPKHPVYQKGLHTLLHHLWHEKGYVNRSRHQDLCVVGMLVSMTCYGDPKDPRIHEMLDYLLEHQVDGGGFNCMWETTHSVVASVHSTIVILEGLYDYLLIEDTYRIGDVRDAMTRAEEALLNRDLYKIQGKVDPIHPFMIKPHYPIRWKYDILRALSYFARKGRPYDPRMKDALDILYKQTKHFRLPKGTHISGLRHFDYQDQGRFNTLRFLHVLKKYRPNIYERMLQERD